MNHLEECASLINDTVCLLDIVAEELEPAPRAVLTRISNSFKNIVYVIEHDKDKYHSSIRAEIFSVTKQKIENLSFPDIIDTFVGVRIDSISAALFSLEIKYLESTNSSFQSIGSAIYEAIHWIDMAKSHISSFIVQSSNAVHIKAA